MKQKTIKKIEKQTIINQKKKTKLRGTFCLQSSLKRRGFQRETGVIERC